MNAKRRVEYTRQLLESIGLEGQRLQMINMSSAMGGQFAEAATQSPNDGGGRRPRAEPVPARNGQTDQAHVDADPERDIAGRSGLTASQRSRGDETS